MLILTAPEMNALVGGLRVLNVDVTNKIAGVLTDSTDALSNNFLLKLTDMKYQWAKTADPQRVLKQVKYIWNHKSDGHPSGAALPEWSQRRWAIASWTFGPLRVQKKLK